MTINTISPEETLTMHTMGNKIKIMMGSETNDIIEKLRESLLQIYQERLEESMRGSKFVWCIIILPHNRAHIQIK